MDSPLILGDTIESQLLLNAYRFIRHIWILAFAWCLYDYFLTYGSEARFLWRGPFLRSKAVFLLNRYYGLFYLLFGNLVMAITPPQKTAFCKAWFLVYMDTMFPMFLTFFTITLGRLHAAFDCNRRLLIVAGLLFGSVLCVLIGVQTYFAANFLVVVLPPTWTGCIPFNLISWSWAPFILLGVSEGAIMVALVVKTLQLLRQGFKPPRVLVVILRDTALYNIFTLVAIVFNIAQTGGPQSVFASWPPMLVALLSTTGSRMLLNIHDVIEEVRGSEEPTELTSVQMFNSDYVSESGPSRFNHTRYGHTFA